MPHHPWNDGAIALDPRYRRTGDEPNLNAQVERRLKLRLVDRPACQDRDLVPGSARLIRELGCDSLAPTFGEGWEHVSYLHHSTVS
jgi:hypothetical protein